MRPGARICELYAKNGTCRVGVSCRFDHPEGMKAAMFLWKERVLKD